MSTKISRIFILLSSLALASCSESVDIQLAPEVNVYLSHDSQRRITLTPQDKEYPAINDWLREHKSGWYTTSGRYPGGVYLKSGSDGIQITKTHVILYSTSSPEPKAIYIQRLGNGDLSEIRNIGQ